MRKTHTFLGILLLLVMIWMSSSGIVLNHRSLFSSVEVGRQCLPDEYLYQHWNYGFFKGSAWISTDSVFLYGNEGIWLTNEENDFLKEWNNGIQPGADNRKISRVVVTPSGKYYAAALYALYTYNKNSSAWEFVSLPRKIDRITDLEVHQDTVVVLTRSELLITTDGKDFLRKELPAGPELDRKRSLFRLIWTLHSGELFGMTGKIIVDLLAFAVIFLSVTGGILYLFPKIIRRKKKTDKSSASKVRTLRFSVKWHNRLGYYLTVPLLILVITGTFLRPPLLITIVRHKVTPPPCTTMNSPNPWHDLLRSLRYDPVQEEWLLYTSEGFFSMAGLEDTPKKISSQAPVSVMGLNVFHQLNPEMWLLGSFNGLILWNRFTGEMQDAFTGGPFIPSGGMPFGNYKVSGFTSDLKDRVILFLYDTGVYTFTPEELFTEMPEAYKNRPMSLWNLALEMHTGRIFTVLGIFTMIYPFIIGLLAVLMLFSGWRVYSKRKKRRLSNGMGL